MKIYITFNLTMLIPEVFGSVIVNCRGEPCSKSTRMTRVNPKCEYVQLFKTHAHTHTHQGFQDSPQKSFMWCQHKDTQDRKLGCRKHSHCHNIVGANIASKTNALPASSCPLTCISCLPLCTWILKQSFYFAEAALNRRKKIHAILNAEMTLNGLYLVRGLVLSTTVMELCKILNQ